MAHSNNTKMHTYGITDISLEQAEELGFGPELWDIEGWVLLRYGALLKWVTVLAFRGIEGGFGWWGGLTHLLELGVPGGSELRVGSSQRGSLLMDRSVVPFRCMSGSKGKSTCQVPKELCEKAFSKYDPLKRVESWSQISVPFSMNSLIASVVDSDVFLMW